MNKIEFNIDLIIEEYSNYVFKIVNNILKDHFSYEDREEVVSDSFYILWKNQDKISTNIKGYLGTIARNCCYEKIRDTKYSYEFKDILDYDLYNGDNERLIIIKEIINGLSDYNKVLYDLFYIKGYKIKEISNITSKSIGTIKIDLYRLRKILKEEYYG